MPDIHYGGVLILILLPYKRAVFSSRSDVTAWPIGRVYYIYRKQNSPALFFWQQILVIQPIACQQWGSHGTTKHSKLLILGSWTCGIYRSGLMLHALTRNRY